MGVGPFSTESTSKNTTVDNDLVGTDQAIVFNVATGKKGASKILAPGATTIDIKGDFSADPAVLQNALNFGQQQSTTFTDALKDIISGASAATAGQAKTLQEVFSKSIDKISALSESAQTEGDTDRNKIILYVVLGLLAVVGAIFVFGKK